MSKWRTLLLHLPPSPVLYRLCTMRRPDRLAARQISDRARRLEHTVEGASGEVKLVHGGAQETLAGGIGVAELADLDHTRVGVCSAHDEMRQTGIDIV